MVFEDCDIYDLNLKERSTFDKVFLLFRRNSVGVRVRKKVRVFTLALTLTLFYVEITGIEPVTF